LQLAGWRLPGAGNPTVADDIRHQDSREPSGFRSSFGNPGPAHPLDEALALREIHGVVAFHARAEACEGEFRV
jgi:hypothetical protein